MPTRLSDKAFFERQDVDTLRADQPMDSGYVWTMLDNVSHLLDESGKYRVNWMSRNGTGFGADDHTARFENGNNYWYTIFPTQPVDRYQYPRYDVRVAVVTGLDATLRVSLVTPGTTPPIFSDTQSGVIGSFTVDVAAPDIVYEWVEGLIPSRSIADANFWLMPAPSVSDGEHSFDSVFLVKLIVECVAPNPPEEGGPVIIGVQVREYLR